MGQGGGNVIPAFVVQIQSDFVKKTICDMQNQLTGAFYFDQKPFIGLYELVFTYIKFIE